jgi:hypothetical protein
VGAARMRLARLRLGGLPLPTGVIVVVSWITIATLLVLASIPGFLDGALIATLDPPTPRWIRAAILAACAVVAASLLVATVLGDARGRRSRRQTVLRDLLASAPGAVVGGLLLASEAVVPATVALAAAGVTVIALHLRLALVARSVLVGALGATPWTAAITVQFTDPDFGLFSWLWIVLLPLAAGFAAFGALFGAARAAETRAGGLRRVFRDDVPSWAVALIVVAVLGIVAARYTFLRGVFGEYDEQLWTFRLAPSWIHGGLVAAAIAAMALISTRRPLTRIGRRVATAGFGAAAALQLVLLGPLVITIAVSTILTGSTVDLTDVAIDAAPWASVGIILLLVAVVAHPVFAGSAGRWMTWLGALYVLPGGVAAAAGPAFDDIPAFWTKPPQVAAMLALAAGALLVANVLRPRLAISHRLLLRLAIIPLVAVHATALLPAPWESALGRAVLAIGVVVAVLFFAPPVTADPLHRAERLLRRTAAQVAALVVFVLALPSVLRGETFEVAGTLWLAIPVAAVLCLTVMPRATPAPTGVPHILVDPEPPERVTRMVADP